MSRNFTVNGAEALLAIAACQRTTNQTGSESEEQPSENVTFAYGAVGRLFPLDMEDLFWREAADANLSVQVQRVLTRPGVYHYQCTIQPDSKGVLN